MELNHEIVPIWRVDEGASPIVNGTGFLTKKDGETLFVTCEHVIEVKDGVEYFFRYRGKEIKGEDFIQNKIEVEVPLGWMNDYGIYRLGDLDVEKPIELDSTLNISETDQLVLVKHGLVDGVQEPIDCARRTDKEFTSLNDQNSTRIKNMIAVKGKGVIKGYSGSPVLLKGTNRCVGFLATKLNNPHIDWFQIIKAQTIEELIDG